MSEAKCTLCGEPLPPGEEMFKFHGYSGDCPAPPLKKPSELTETQAAVKLANLSKALLDDATAECRVLQEALGHLIESADGAFAMIEAKRKAGDFDHWESFEMGDFAFALQGARDVLASVSPPPRGDDTESGA